LSELVLFQFESIAAEGFLLINIKFYSFLGANLKAVVLNFLRIRQVVVNSVKQVLDSFILISRAHENRDKLVGNHISPDRSLYVVFSDFFLVKVKFLDFFVD